MKAIIRGVHGLPVDALLDQDVLLAFLPSTLQY